MTNEKRVVNLGEFSDLVRITSEAYEPAGFVLWWDKYWALPESERADYVDALYREVGQRGGE